SGGQKLRVDIARALLSRPDILFLYEPTTGLDIQTLKSIWDLLYRLQKYEGMTIILTTHYLDEADEADHIYIVDHGKEIAQRSATAI
nr:ABC transporter ATP-binding protein [Streptococcus oralis]